MECPLLPTSTLNTQLWPYNISLQKDTSYRGDVVLTECSSRFKKNRKSEPIPKGWGYGKHVVYIVYILCIYPPTPAYSQSLGGEAPGTPQGEAVGQAEQNPSKHFQRRRMKQLAKPSRTLPSTSKGLSEASPAGRPVAASLWPVRSLKATLGILDRPQTALGSWQASCGLSVACPKPASSFLMGFRRRR